MSISPILKKRRITNGFCLRCHTPHLPGLLLCERHRALRTATWQRRVERQTALGLCLRCNDPARPGKKSCEKHGNKIPESKHAGCMHCGDKPLVLGTRQCILHVSEQSKRKLLSSTKYRHDKSANGICPRCVDPVVPGKSMCQIHLDDNKRRVKEYYQTRKDSGLCMKCDENQFRGSWYCLTHRTEQAAKLIAWKQKRMAKNANAKPTTNAAVSQD